MKRGNLDRQSQREDKGRHEKTIRDWTDVSVSQEMPRTADK